MADNNVLHTTASGLQICLVPRDQLRVKTAAFWLAIPSHLKDVLATMPPTPTSYDWGMNERIVYDTLGNDVYGDCFYTTACHGVQTWLGNSVANFIRFDPNQVVNRYLQLSGGNNGLSDATLFAEWTTGVVGPNGPHKIFARATLDPTDVPTCTAAIWLFGGGSYTGALPDAWIMNPHPGQVWTNSGPPNQRNGHAVHVSGRTAAGNWVMRTWGITPPIEMTQAGFEGSDPELVVEASVDWFDARGYAPNKLHYTQLAQLWTAMSGAPWPASPFPAPTPVPPDRPPVQPPDRPPVDPGPPIGPPIPPAVPGLPLHSVLGTMIHSLYDPRIHWNDPRYLRAHIIERQSADMKAAWPDGAPI